MIEVGNFKASTCSGVSRRSFLKLGASLPMGLGLAGSGSQLLATEGQAKSVILLWLWGAPSHIETFDPKPKAPKEVRGEFNPISTAVPGVHFSEKLVRLAKAAGDFAVIRSIRHNQGNHGAGNHYMMTGAPPPLLRLICQFTRLSSFSILIRLP